jgi:hypothetical protein
MNLAARLAIVVSIPFCGLTQGDLAVAGDLLPQIDCDSLVYESPETRITFAVWNKGHYNICTTEIRPLPTPERGLTAIPILSCEAPPGWICEPLEGAPGGVVLRGCVPPSYTIGPPIQIRIAGRAGKFRADFYTNEGLLWREFIAFFYCGSAPVPAITATWGLLKSVYR